MAFLTLAAHFAMVAPGGLMADQGDARRKNTDSFHPGTPIRARGCDISGKCLIRPLLWGLPERNQSARRTSVQPKPGTPSVNGLTDAMECARLCRQLSPPSHLDSIHDDGFHQFGRRTGPSAGLNGIQLADDIDRGASCDSGHITHTS